MSLKGMVDKMHGENGIDIQSNDISHRATAALLRAYKSEAIRDNASIDRDSPIDGVVLSRNNDRYGDVGGRYAILYQGDPDSPTVRTLAVPTQALTAPAEQSFEEVNRINAQREQQFAQTREREQTMQQNQAREQEQMNMGSRSLF